MLYAILCYNEEAVVGAWSKEKDDEVMADHAVVMRRLSAEGKLGPVARLLPTTAATTVRPGAEPLLIDGPFAETKECLAGFYLVEARDLNEAIQIASRIPPAQIGSVEVRPVRPIREAPNAHRK